MRTASLLPYEQNNKDQVITTNYGKNKMSEERGQVAVATPRKNIWPVVLVTCCTLAFVLMPDAFGGK